MNRLKLALVLIAASAAVSTASAQNTGTETAACRDSATTAMYRRCALWMDGGKVRRGEQGAVVGRRMLIIPAHLSRLVAGDSAMAYANLFERRSKQSTALVVLSGILIGISVSNAHCGGQYSGCAYDWGFNSAGFDLLAGGVVLTGLGVHFQERANQAGTQAVWWNNARFAR
jgi:hypothetical protein